MRRETGAVNITAVISLRKKPPGDSIYIERGRL